MLGFFNHPHLWSKQFSGSSVATSSVSMLLERHHIGVLVFSASEIRLRTGMQEVRKRQGSGTEEVRNRKSYGRGTEDREEVRKV